MPDYGESIPLSHPAARDKALAGLPNAFGNTWERCNAMHETTGHPTFLWRYRSGTAECICPFAVRAFERHEDIVTPYGFSGFTGIGDGSEMVESWRRFTARRKFVAGYIGLNPLLVPDTFRTLPECKDDGSLYFLDLTSDSQALLRAMSRGRRRQIEGWESEGKPLLEGQAALGNFLCANLVPFLRSRGATATYAFSEETLRLLLAAPSTFLLGAGSAGAIEAATLFAHSPLIGEHMFIVSVPGGERHTAALTWAGALALKDKGVRWLSMGGGVSGDDSIASLKERFGPLKLPKPILQQVYDDRQFAELCRSIADGDPGAGRYFPPYHRSPAHVS